eukprot:gene8501-11527_t
MSTEKFCSKLLAMLINRGNCIDNDTKKLLESFHDRAGIRLSQIFESDTHRSALMNAIHSTKNKHSEFIITTKSGISTDGISTLQSLFQDILDDLGIPKKSLYLKKGEDSVINALYICILDMLRDKLVAEDFKYTTRFEFMIAYENVFKDESDKEKELLWQTANWMCILFKMVRANANLGLAIEVVSKLLEGWNVKYITGGGMKPATANRVHIYRVEGNVPISHREKSRAAQNEPKRT